MRRTAVRALRPEESGTSATSGKPVPPPAGVAVVGLGNAGRQHLAAVDATPGARLAAVIETDQDRARWAGAAGLPVRTLEQALADPAVDLLAVCLPPGQRPPVTRAALAAGKHLLVEKLPARDSAELRDLLRRATRAGLTTGVMFQHRYVLPEALRAGAAERLADAAAVLLVSRPRSATHFRAGDWRSRPEIAVGGVTAHLGVHYLDIACQLLGEPAEVTPLARADAAPGIDVQVCGHIRFANGAHLTVTVTSRAAVRHEQLTVLGERDWLSLLGGAVTGQLDGQPIAEPARPAAELRVEVYRELVAALRGGPPADLAALSRSAGVTAALDALLARPAEVAAEVAG